MDEAECDALTDYVRSLPVPVAIEPADDQESAQLKSGEETFKTIGCAHCHLPKLGGVEGIYSDLLLHDMSPRLGDADAYSVFVGDPPRADGCRGPGPPRHRSASIQEWRTPPLWGLRDSGPYLHDGRAATIDQADRVARRPGCVVGETLRGAFAPSQAAPRRVPQVTRRPPGEPMTRRTRRRLPRRPVARSDRPRPLTGIPLSPTLGTCQTGSGDP